MPIFKVTVEGGNGKYIFERSCLLEDIHTLTEGVVKLFNSVGIEPETPEDSTGEEWSSAEFHRLWQSLSTPSKKALRAIAKNREGCSKTELEKSVGLTGQALGGSLSGITRLAKNYENKKLIFERDEDGDYIMSSEIAEMVEKKPFVLIKKTNKL